MLVVESQHFQRFCKMFIFFSIKTLCRIILTATHNGCAFLLEIFNLIFSIKTWENFTFVWELILFLKGSDFILFLNGLLKTIYGLLSLTFCVKNGKISKNQICGENNVINFCSKFKEWNWMLETSKSKNWQNYFHFICICI